MLNNEKIRSYVFRDLYLGREVEVGMIAAAGYFNRAQSRFQYVRSFMPKVSETDKMTVTDGVRSQSFDKVKSYVETDVTTEYPSFARRMIKSHKQPKTWLGPTGEVLSEPPEGFKE